MKVVVVESPAKAKTINKYLGEDYKVLASFGHVRSLPSKSGSVKPDDSFSMDWQVDSKSKKHIQAIKDACKNAKELYLASDPDREGEAISWHVQEILGGYDKITKKISLKRVVFHEITKNAIVKAMETPRNIDENLVNAYFARLSLDYLVGFNISPVLWRKLPGAKSAGRVQSVALRLVSEREKEIHNFKTQEYWSIQALFKTDDDKQIQAQLIQYNNKKLEKFSIPNQIDADNIVDEIKHKSFSVLSIDEKSHNRRPQAPFTTSTLQQEAARKLFFSARKTMQVSQNLYEAGFITYMRTDAVILSKEALTSARNVIKELYSKEFLPKNPNSYVNKSKNAQEAHEAIRPTDFKNDPKMLKQNLDKDQFKLYDLIWKRTIASQMTPAKINSNTITIVSHDNKEQFKATGSVIAFLGFLKLYQEGSDEDNEQNLDNNKLLPNLLPKQSLSLNKKPNAEQHFTKPPARFSEASLVKELESRGIGRPSTYATILSVIEARGYAQKDKSRRFFATKKGLIVTEFLKKYFKDIVTYSFTAELENKLDSISTGSILWKQVLKEFWDNLQNKIQQTNEVGQRDVLGYLSETMGDIFFHDNKTRTCPDCDDGIVNLKMSKHGPFIGCSNYPDCSYTEQILDINDSSNDNEDNNIEQISDKILGKHPDSNEDIVLKKGPYGWYVQLGETKNKKKPKRAGIPKGTNVENFALEDATQLLALPKELGMHPETNLPIVVGIGRFGPFIKYNDKFTSLKNHNVLTLDLNTAVETLNSSNKKTDKSFKKELGIVEQSKLPIYLQDGRYGMYIKYGKKNIAIPKNIEPETLVFTQACDLIKEKLGSLVIAEKPKSTAKRKKTKPTTKKEAPKPKTKTRKKSMQEK